MTCIMRLKPAPIALGIAALSLSQNVEANEENPKFAPSLNIITGISPDLVPLWGDSSLALDGHSIIGVTTDGEPLVDGGTNIGFAWDNPTGPLDLLELKPIGAHIGCHDGERCQGTYSVEGYATISPVSFGFGLNLNQEGAHEWRLPVALGGFSVTPAFHKENTQWHPSGQFTMVFDAPYSLLNTHSSFGLHLLLSRELVSAGFDIRWGHAHPH